MTLAKPFDRPTTSGDVAQRAGVSRSTVSKVLNGDDSRFSLDTRERVRSAAQELDYRPSVAARSLVSGISDTIIVLVSTSSFGSEIQDAIEQVALGIGRVGANVVVRFAASELTNSLTAIRALRPLALIDLVGIDAAERSMLEQRGTLVVPPLYDDAGETPEAALIRVQLSALDAAGPRAITFASPADRLGTYATSRWRAIRGHFARIGLDEPSHVEVPGTLVGAAECLRRLLDSTSDPLGVVCYNDEVALALLAAARALDVAVPGRLAIVGVDNTVAGRLWSPPLTSVQVDLSGLMDTLARQLSARLAGAPLPAAAAPALAFELVPGATT